MKILRTIRNIILRIYYNHQLHKIIDKYTWKSSVMYSVEDWEKVVKLQELIKELKK